MCRVKNLFAGAVVAFLILGCAYELPIGGKRDPVIGETFHLVFTPFYAETKRLKEIYETRKHARFPVSYGYPAYNEAVRNYYAGVRGANDVVFVDCEGGIRGDILIKNINAKELLAKTFDVLEGNTKIARFARRRQTKRGFISRTSTSRLCGSSYFRTRF
jgi:hypothetical protein